MDEIIEIIVRENGTGKFMRRERNISIDAALEYLNQIKKSNEEFKKIMEANKNV